MFYGGGDDGGLIVELWLLHVFVEFESSVVADLSSVVADLRSAFMTAHSKASPHGFSVDCLSFQAAPSTFGALNTQSMWLRQMVAMLAEMSCQ